MKLPWWKHVKQHGLRQCVVCNRWKKPDKFSGNRRTCKDCAWHPPTPAERKAITGLLRADSNNQRAEVMGVTGTFTDEEWQALLDEYGHRCVKCGTTDNITVDHIVPLSKGGTNTISNIQPLCMTCNLRKGTQTIDYRWRAKVP